MIITSPNSSCARHDQIMAVGAAAASTVGTETRRQASIGGRARGLAGSSYKKVQDVVADSTAIRPRFGAVGKHGSIAVVERFIRTMKDEATRRIVIPLRRLRFRSELNSFLSWYNEHRPHRTLRGKTPNEVYFRLWPANGRPRIEPRTRWPRRSPCAGPRTLVAGQPGDRFKLQVDFHDGKRHLPIVSLKRAA